jgi:uncharacterized protein with ParB-like and HNH nuclease domain
MFRNNEFIEDLFAADTARGERRLVLGGLERVIIQDHNKYYVRNVQRPFDWEQDDMELNQSNVVPQEVPELTLGSTTSSTTLPPNSPNHSPDNTGTTHFVSFLTEAPN